MQEDSDVLKKRLRLEYRASDNRFAILPHKPNYLLPVTFNNRPNQESLDAVGENRDVDNIEVKFQVSFKTPIWEEPFGENSALFLPTPDSHIGRLITLMYPVHSVKPIMSQKFTQGGQPIGN